MFFTFDVKVYETSSLLFTYNRDGVPLLVNGEILIRMRVNNYYVNVTGSV